MHTTSGSWLARVSRIAVLGVLLVPIAASAQRAGRSPGNADMPAAVSAFLNLDSVQPRGPAAINAKTGAQHGHRVPERGAIRGREDRDRFTEIGQAEPLRARQDRADSFSYRQ